MILRRFHSPKKQQTPPAQHRHFPAASMHQQNPSTPLHRNILPTRHFRPPGQREWVVLDVRGLRTPSYPRYQMGFDLHRGEIVALTGESGSGKIDVLRTTSGQSKALSGDIIINGERCRVRCAKDARNHGIAVLFQQRNLVQGKTAAWNITHPATSRFSLSRLLPSGKGSIKQAAGMAALVKLDIEHLSTPTTQLSAGDQMKVALARALSTNPMVLLLEHPGKDLDTAAKKDIYEVLDCLASEGMAILFTSRDMDEMMALADRALVMHKGELAGQLSRNELTADAIHSFSCGHRLFGF